MAYEFENWRTQIRKGYLELCLLLLIRAHKRIYGFDILERLEKANLPMKEGTLYPILNRMSADGLLATVWETEGAKGHPRKFYSLTSAGQRLVDDMSDEFKQMVSIYNHLQKSKGD